MSILYFSKLLLPIPIDVSRQFNRGLSSVQRSGDKGQRWFFPNGINSNGPTAVSSQAHADHYLGTSTDTDTPTALTAASSSNNEIYVRLGWNGTQAMIELSTSDYYIDGSGTRESSSCSPDCWLFAYIHPLIL